MKKIIFPLVALILVTATAFKLISNKKAVDAKVYHLDLHKKVAVQADTVAMGIPERNFTYTGTFIAHREVMINPQVHGEVTTVLFKEGDLVKQGQRLLQIDDEMLRAQYISVEANYETAKRNLTRYETASGSGGVSQLQLDTYRLNLKNAESQMKQLSKQIQLSSIKAPFSGTITFKDVEPGSLAGNTAVARITDLSILKLEIAVPEGEITLFKIGEIVDIRTDAYAGKVFRGKIEYASDRADAAHNYVVKIMVENDSFTPMKAGMYGTATIGKIVESESITIPRRALIGSAKNPQVFVIRNDVAELVSIQTGSGNGEAIEVVHGLSAGDVIVTGGQINLTSGSKVEIAKP